MRTSVTTGDCFARRTRLGSPPARCSLNSNLGSYIRRLLIVASCNNDKLKKSKFRESEELKLSFLWIIIMNGAREESGGLSFETRLASPVFGLRVYARLAPSLSPLLLASIAMQCRLA